MEYFAAHLDQLKQVQKMAIKIGNKPILLVDTPSGIYAIRDKCPHMGSPLSTGMIADDVVTCKYHGLSVSLVDGEVTDQAKANFLRMAPYARNVTTYQVILRNNDIYLDL